MIIVKSPEEEKKARLIEKLKRELGPSILSALENKDVIEIILNPDGAIWFDSLTDGMVASGEKIDPMRAYNIIGTVAAIRKKIVNDENQSLECTLPMDGSRFTALIPDSVENASFNIRKRALRIYSLEDYRAQGIVTQSQVFALQAAIKKNLSIMVVGGPATGKTTFCNALLREMVKLGAPTQRFVIIEDKPELQCTASNKLMIMTTEHFSHLKALHHALVARPDKICVGECRGAEMLTLLKAWNTGTKGGITTIHANDSRAALSRIEGMIEENAGIKAQPSFIVEAVDVICSLAFNPKTGRRLNEVLMLKGYERGQYVFENMTNEESDRDETELQVA